MNSKPRGLDWGYGAQFGDESVVKAYDLRPRYPPETFQIIAELVSDPQAHVLELGCGGGELTIPLCEHVGRIDALDPSVAMLRAARAREGGASPKIHWRHAKAEELEGAGNYALVVAASSFHWMDWDVVVPKVRDSLKPGGRLVLIDGPRFGPQAWQNELTPLIAQYSTNTDYEPYDLVDELTARGYLKLEQRVVTRPVPFEQSVARHVELMHSGNGFSRERMSPAAAAAFDERYRRLLERYCPDGIVRVELIVDVSWGVPAG